MQIDLFELNQLIMILKATMGAQCADNSLDIFSKVFHCTSVICSSVFSALESPCSSSRLCVRRKPIIKKTNPKSTSTSIFEAKMP